MWDFGNELFQQAQVNHIKCIPTFGASEFNALSVMHDSPF